MTRDYSQIRFSEFDVIRITYVSEHHLYNICTTAQNIESRGKSVFIDLKRNNDYLHFCNGNQKFLLLNLSGPECKYDKHIEVRMKFVFYTKGKPELELLGNSLIPVFGINGKFSMLDRKSGFVRFIESVIYQNFKEKIYPYFNPGPEH